MTDILSSVLPTNPTTDQVAEAAPLRAQVRGSVLKRYDIFEKELPTFYDAGLSYWQIRPLKNFLESEIAWWNANVELTTQQVTTRKTSYIEQLTSLNKNLGSNLKKALAALPPDKAQVILDKLKSDKADGFVGTSDQPTPTPTTSIDLSGSTASVDLSGIQQSIDLSGAAASADQPPAKETTWSDDISSASTSAFKAVGIILYICIALRFAAFAANDLLYKPLGYRVLAFIYSFIFAPLLLPYYLYREIVHWFWPNIDAPHFESIFPIKPYDPAEPLTIDKRIYGYADTPKIRSWIQMMQQQELASRIAAVSNTNFLNDLIASKQKTSS